jgi:hypothetical protein
MPPITSIAVFLARVRTCTALQDDGALERRIATWLAYYRTLQFVRERYHQTNTAYIQAITRYLHTRERLPRATRPVTPAEEARAEAEALRDHLQDKYASFYIFTIGLLDSMAEVFRCYLGLVWPRSDTTHARLTREFPALCREQGLVLAPTALPRLMRELHAALVATPSRLTALIDEHPEEHLMAMSTAINVYIAAMMQFFARNEDHSVLRSAFAARR